jgi:hypothetical protein
MVILLPCCLPPPAAGARLTTSCCLAAIDSAAASPVTPQKPASGWSRTLWGGCGGAAAPLARKTKRPRVFD